MGLTRKLMFNLEKTLRELGGRLLTLRVPLPVGFTASPLKNDGRLTPEEHSFLIWLAAAHIARHSRFEARPGGPRPRPCPDRDTHCHLHGIAQAILIGCDALRDRKEIPHVTQLREAFKAGRAELRKLSDAIEDYLQNCKLLHEGKWKDITEEAQMNGSPIHDHVAVCEWPQNLHDQIAELADFMNQVDMGSLQPQYSSIPLARGFSLRQRPRPLLLAEMQSALVDDGWSYLEAGELIDDGESTEVEKIIERVRKRVNKRFSMPKTTLDREREKAKGATQGAAKPTGNANDTARAEDAATTPKAPNDAPKPPAPTPDDPDTPVAA
jgi:hypothetical protein